MIELWELPNAFTSEGQLLIYQLLIQFARIHTSSLINIEKILSRPIVNFYKSDDINVIAAELWLIKTRPTSFYKKHNLL